MRCKSLVLALLGILAGSPAFAAQVSGPGLESAGIMAALRYPPSTGYIAPVTNQLFGAEGDSFFGAAGGQSLSSGGTYANIIGGGPVPGSDIYQRSGYLVAPAGSFQHAISGSSPAALGLRPLSTRADNGNYLSTSGATLSGSTLSISVNNSPAAQGPSILVPGTVLSIAGVAGTITVSSVATASLGAAAPWSYTVSNPLAQSASAATATAVPLQVAALSAVSSDSYWEYTAPFVGGAFNETNSVTSPQIWLIEDAHNGAANITGANKCYLDSIDQFIRAMGPTGGVVGADPAHTSTLCTWAGWPAGQTVHGLNDILFFADNYRGDEERVQEIHTIAATVTPTNNQGISFQLDSATGEYFPSRWFSDSCAGYPTGVVPSSLTIANTYNGVSWAGKTYNPVPVVIYGGTGNAAPIIGTRVSTLTGVSGQYTLTITATTATYGFNSVDVGKSVYLDYCFIATYNASTGSGLFMGGTLQAYLDFYNYYNSKSASFTAPSPLGTGTSYGLPGASSYSHVHTIPVWEFTNDPDGLAEGVNWPRPGLFGTSGAGNHVNVNGAVLIGNLVGQTVKSVLGTGYQPFWKPNPANNYRIAQLVCVVSCTNLTTTVPVQYLSKLSSAPNGFEFCTSDTVPVCAVSPGGTGVLTLGHGASISAATFNTTTGALSITYATARGNNSFVYMFDDYLVDVNGNRIPAVKGAPAGNLVYNNQLGYEVCGKGQSNACGGNGTFGQQAGGTLAGFGTLSAGNTLNCGDAAGNYPLNGVSLGQAGSNYIPQAITLQGNTALAASLNAGALSITCTYAVPPNMTDGIPRFRIQVEGYFPSSATMTLLMSSVVVPPYVVSTGNPATSDLVRGHATFVLEPGNLGHLVGVSPPVFALGANVTTPSTIMGMPCADTALTAGNACSTVSATCTAGSSGDAMSDLVLIDGTTTKYYEEDCLTPPITTSVDGSGVSNYTVKVTLPGTANAPVSYEFWVMNVAAFETVN